jgi:hypothetical protein
MSPKVNEKGGKSITLLSKQTNRSLHISTPLLMTWGISDFVDEKGESDGKFSISLNFPNDEYRTASTDLFLQKLKDFENKILDDAVENSELWWGQEMSREICKHTFFPVLKYSRNKDTKKIDFTRPPSIRAKVPFYNNEWNVEIYDTNSNILFPCENKNLTPLDFVPKLSNVACVIQCGGIWIGGKGWGLTWKMIQCIVKPREIVSVFGKCQIQLSKEDKDIIDKQVIQDEATVEEVIEKELNLNSGSSANAISTNAEDTDDESPLSAYEEMKIAEPIVQQNAVAAPAKKIIKRAAPPPPETPAPEAAPVPAEAPKPATTVKKVVKKVAAGSA